MNLKKILTIILFFCISSNYSCKEYIHIDPPVNSLIPATVFKNNDLATAAVLGIYQQMELSGFASGDSQSISTVCALAGDEFIGYSAATQLIYDNQVVPLNGSIDNMWASLYKRIYDANAIMEGLEKSSQITPSVKTQLQGEAMFCRAFCYFYLVNLFGPVPLYLSSDYTLNRTASRAAESSIYEQVIKDLKAAELLLGDSYIDNERIRPNKSTVQALLSRVYLYLGDWTNADKYATAVIDKESTYKLVQLDQVFLKNSMETIWQLMSGTNTNTKSGFLLILIATPNSVSLRTDFVSTAFENNDLRKDAWVKGFGQYFYPFKYKVRSSTTITEYTMIFRLAEQFLIRAEARVNQNNFAGAIADIDKIRGRAGLLLIKDTNLGISKNDLKKLIQKERRVELFSEWGNRWFDLKRTGQSTEVLAPVKTNWKANYSVFPIPQNEISRNVNIVQNTDY